MTTDTHQPIPLTPIPDHIHCPKCAYDLTASTSQKCSECGYDLAGFRQIESAIPWTHRKTQGYLRTYAKTVWLVIFKHKKFCEEIVRPVNYGNARKFQLVTILLTYLPAIATVAAAYILYPQGETQEIAQGITFFRSRSNPTVLDLAYMDVWPVILFLAGLLLCLLATTSVPSYFFHPPQISTRQQNRAIALSYYAAGPLALILFAYVIGITTLYSCRLLDWGGGSRSIFLPSYYDPSIEMLIFGGFALAFMTSCSVYIRRIYQMHKSTMPLARNNRIALITLLPIVWLLLVFLCTVCIPYGIIYILVAIKSLS